MNHTFFLWGSYAFTAVVIVAELISLLLRRKNALRLAAMHNEERDEL
jgi:heme exporter protein CcmD